METFTIGRESSSDIHLSEKSVSGQHAEVVITSSKKIFLTDCASQNGTFVWRNERWTRIQQEFVLEDDWLRFGDVKLRGRTLAQCKRRETKGGRGNGQSGGSSRNDVITGAVRRNEFGEPVSRE